MVVNELPRLTLLSETASRNALLPILVIVSGIITDEREEAPENALSPMDSRWFGRVSNVSDDAWVKALLPMLVILSGIISSVKFVSPVNVLEPVEMESLPYIMLVRLLH
jgi:hypothetical protein